MIAVGRGGFHPHCVSTLYLGVHVCYLSMMLYYAFTALSNEFLIYWLKLNA